MPKIDWNLVIPPVVNGILLPELIAFIRAFYLKNGEIPTEEQLKEALAMNIAEGVSMWEEWFKTHPE